MTITTGLVALAPWGACALLWRRGWFGLARAAAAVATLILSFVAAYYWQAYGRDWALWVPFVLGSIAVSACGRAKGERFSADGTAFVLVAIPIFFMWMTFSYFTKMFLLIRADATVRERVRSPAPLYSLPPAERAKTIEGLIGALANDDAFVRWGAVHFLWSGAAPSMTAAAAEPTARAVLAPCVCDQPVVCEYLRRDGIHYLESLREAGGPALLKMLREGNPDMRRRALESLSRLGPAIKDAALPELVMVSSSAAADIRSSIEDARKALGISDDEWRRVQSAGR